MRQRGGLRVANYTAYGREGDWGASPPVPFYASPTQPALTGAAYDATLTRYQQGGLNAPIAVANYTPGGAYAGALPEQLPAPVAASPAANNGAAPLSYYTTAPGYTPTNTQAFASPAASPAPVNFTPSATEAPSPVVAASPSPVSLIPFNPGGAGGTPYAPPSAPSPAAPATPTPNVEQVTVNATPTPQQVTAPAISPLITAGQLAGQTPNLTPNQTSGLSPGMTPAGTQPGSKTGGGSQGGGGSSGGGAQPQQPQQPQQRPTTNPISIMLQNLFGQSPLQPVNTRLPAIRSTPAAGYVPTVTRGGRTVYVPATAAGGGGGMDVSGPGSSPAGGIYPGGSPGAVNSLFAPSSTNIWLPLVVGGLLLYAATQ